MSEHAGCPSCRAAVQAEWNHCPRCGARLSPSTCPGCGIEVRPGWRVCPECEARLLCRACGGRLSRASGTSGDLSPATAGPVGRTVVEPESGISFRLVPGGTFEMGDVFGEGAENELPVHTVRLDDFFMAATPVTQEQWRRLMAENPSRFVGDDHPVEQVAWKDVQAFLERLNAASSRLGRFDLPSEAQWEYAARSGGRRERYAGGDAVEAVAWYGENSEGSTRPVGGKRANGLGLMDMSGNVWEWCRDRYSDSAYASHAPDNPVGSGGGDERVIRGGAWHLDAWSVRTSRRFSYPEGFTGPALGFRPILIVSK